MSSGMSRIAPALLVALGLWVCGGDSAQADGGKKGSYPAGSAQWSGFYVGAGVGSAWGDAVFNFESEVPDPTPARSIDLDSAIAGGIFVGYQASGARSSAASRPAPCSRI